MFPFPGSSLRVRALAFLGLATAVQIAGCGALTKAPRAEALIVVDTDLAVPKLAGTLRVDVFRAGDGPRSWQGLDWIDSREFVLESPLDWPASMGVTMEDDAESARFVVRLRLHRSGKTRSYRGERFLPPADETPGDPSDILLPPAPESGEPPRLFHGDVDVTPIQEPAPPLTVDRLVAFELHAEERWKTSVLLEGDCAGVQADLAGRRACSSGALVAIADAPRDADVSLPPRGASVVGQWPVLTGPRIPIECDADAESARHGDSGTTGRPLFDEEVCIPGGAFIFGNAHWGARVPADDPKTAGIGEERIAVVPRMFVDKYEFSVARARRRRVTPDLLQNDDPLDYSDPYANMLGTCSFGAGADRDALPLNCVADVQARALCESEGREPSLLVVHQYAFLNGYLDAPTPWPWAEPVRIDPCAGAILEREAKNPRCARHGLVALDAPRERHASPADVSVRGIHDLLGSVAELQADAALPFAARCWRTASAVLPSCREGSDSRWVVGRSWVDTDNLDGNPLLAASVPKSGTGTVGFRCMRRVDP